MGRPLRRLLAERRVERIDERFWGRGHRGLLPCVHRRPPWNDPSPIDLRFGDFALQPNITSCHICTLGGRNLMTAIRVIRTKMASTAVCVIAKGGSVCVGANALRAETFMKLCATKTKTLR